MRKIFPYITIVFLLLLASSTVYGQEITPTPQDALLWLMIFVIVGISVVCIVLSLTILALVGKAKEKSQAESSEGLVTEKVEHIDLWQKLKARLTAAVPITREAEIDMGHSYDGIRELDNKLPPWWLYGFYLTIVIGVAYFYYYHIATDWSSDQEYRTEMAEGAKVREAYLAKVANLVNEETVKPLSSSTDLTAGKTIYKNNCVACHGDKGQGGIGPNLADAYWLHGGGIKNVFKTVKYGVIERGMTPWKDVLKPQEIQQVSSFILTMEGSNPPNPKNPQGEIWTPPAETNAPDTLQAISMNP